MSSAAGLSIFASQFFSLLAVIFCVTVCLAVVLIPTLLFGRERNSARAFYQRESHHTDFCVGKKPPAREASPYRRGQFQERRKASL